MDPVIVVLAVSAGAAGVAQAAASIVRHALAYVERKEVREDELDAEERREGLRGPPAPKRPDRPPGFVPSTPASRFEIAPYATWAFDVEDKQAGYRCPACHEKIVGSMPFCAECGLAPLQDHWPAHFHFECSKCGGVYRMLQPGAYSEPPPPNCTCSVRSGRVAIFYINCPCHGPSRV